MARGRRRGAATVLLIGAAVLLLGGCSRTWTPGIRRTADGAVHVRAPVCPGATVDPAGPTIELSRVVDGGAKWVRVSIDTDPTRTADGDLVVAARPLREGTPYGVQVRGLGRPWADVFEADDLPADGSYAVPLDRRFPATASGRSDLDEVVCAELETEWGPLLVLGGIVLGVLAVGAALLVALLRWSSRPPRAPPAPF